MFERVFTLIARVGANEAAKITAGQIGKRWSAALRREPRLATDLIELGGVFSIEAVELKDGVSGVAPLDPYRLAYEAGRRDMALQLLAAAHMTNDEINDLMRTDNE